MKAIIVNRIGDFGVTLAMFAIFYSFNSLDFSTIFALSPYIANTNFIFLNLEVDKLTLICLLLFIGVIGKSAQIGLHT